MAKKATAKKATNTKAKPKAASARQSNHRTAGTQSAPEIVQAKLTPIKTSAVKRPPLTPGIPRQVIGYIISDLTNVKNNLDVYAAHLRALDRKRLAMDNPEFLPNYLSQDRYTDDFDHFAMLQTVVVLERQVHELLLNIDTECNDVFYTDGLDFYAAVREAAKRRVDAAERIYEDLFDTYFKRKKIRRQTQNQKKNN
jgi:hypothetical protein